MMSGTRISLHESVTISGMYWKLRKGWRVKAEASSCNVSFFRICDSSTKARCGKIHMGETS